MWLAKEMHEIPPQAQEDRLDIVIAGIEGKHLLGLRPAFLLHDRQEELLFLLTLLFVALAALAVVVKRPAA